MPKFESNLKNDINAAIELLDQAYPAARQLDNIRYNILLNMTLNLGCKIKSYKKLFFALDRCDYQQASTEMLNSYWAQQMKEQAYGMAEIMRQAP